MSDTVRLIVNADDFGIAKEVDDGIIEAHERGIVTSTSIMATGPTFEHAAALAREHSSLAVGVHLVLTEQRPLVGDTAPSLVGADGRFLPHAMTLARRRFAAGLVLDDVRRELDAQIRRVREAGLAISHLDGHQHVHALPGVARVVMDLAAVHGIRAVRYPVERLRGYMLRAPRHLGRLAEQAALRVACAFSPLRRLRRCDEFVGFYFGGQLTERNLATVLTALPPGRTAELMCHPGRVGMQAPGWQYAWAAELAALTNPSVRELVAARRIQLISYRDL